MAAAPCLLQGLGSLADEIAPDPDHDTITSRALGDFGGARCPLRAITPKRSATELEPSVPSNWGSESASRLRSAQPLMHAPFEQQRRYLRN